LRYGVAKILDQTFSVILWFPGRIGPKLWLMLQRKRALTKGLRPRFGGEKHASAIDENVEKQHGKSGTKRKSQKKHTHLANVKLRPKDQH